jgi:hypothetical protein
MTAAVVRPTGDNSGLGNDAGPLLRAIVLRARLAAAVGDGDTARRWAVVAIDLLDNPDPFLRPLAAEMRSLPR